MKIWTRIWSGIHKVFCDFRKLTQPRYCDSCCRVTRPHWMLLTACLRCCRSYPEFREKEVK